MRAQIKEAVKTACTGARKVRITFKRSATGDINYLLGMKRAGIVEFAHGDEVVLMAVEMSGDWEHDENRVLVVTLTDTFDDEWFVGRMWRALDAIEVVN